MWSSSSGRGPSGRCTRAGASTADRFASNPLPRSGGTMGGVIDLSAFSPNIKFNSFSCLNLMQTVAMKFILKHGKSDKDIHNLRQEIEASALLLLVFSNSDQYL